MIGDVRNARGFQTVRNSLQLSHQSVERLTRDLLRIVRILDEISETHLFHSFLHDLIPFMIATNAFPLSESTADNTLSTFSNSAGVILNVNVMVDEKDSGSNS